MSQRARVVLAIVVVALGVAATATFLPSTAPHDGSRCGTWLAPELGRGDAAELTREARRIRNNYATIGGDQATIDAERAKLDAIMAEVEVVFRECDATLTARRTVAVSSLVIGGFVAVGVLVAWPGRRETAI